MDLIEIFLAEGGRAAKRRGGGRGRGAPGAEWHTREQEEIGQAADCNDQVCDAVQGKPADLRGVGMGRGGGGGGAAKK